ncbi:hypothetical protein IU449_17950 [Nocardia higoensis]|uniref:Secreted protein n=1 Tax=Nocardia higoensis TaxID=228599 RepID=A0ABS0DE42_9NOCA|nr:hypothetical protein [Nocardia higoensis]MBF6356405.1 hypothetical protein [Nocardia higoensis]
MTTALPLLIALAVTLLAYRAVRREPVGARVHALFGAVVPRDSDPGFYDHQRQLRDITAVRTHEELDEAA